MVQMTISSNRTVRLETIRLETILAPVIIAPKKFIHCVCPFIESVHKILFRQRQHLNLTPVANVSYSTNTS